MAREKAHSSAGARSAEIRSCTGSRSPLAAAARIREAILLLMASVRLETGRIVKTSSNVFRSNSPSSGEKRAASAIPMLASHSGNVIIAPNGQFSEEWAIRCSQIRIVNLLRQLVAFSKNEAVFLRAEVREWTRINRDQNCLSLIAKVDWNEALETSSGS